MSAWPWGSSESTDKIIPAFVSALHAVSDVVQNKQAHIETKTGSGVHYGYATLDAVLEQAKPVLAENGLAIAQPPSSDGVHTIVMHTSGEWLSFPPLEIRPNQQSPQGQGSAITYARRYAVLGVLNIATEDDDGKEAARPADPVASTTQLRTIGSQLRRLIGNDREAGLAFIADAAGRQVASSKELTTREAAAVIAALRNAIPEAES